MPANAWFLRSLARAWPVIDATVDFIPKGEFHSKRPLFVSVARARRCRPGILPGPRAASTVPTMALSTETIIAIITLLLTVPQTVVALHNLHTTWRSTKTTDSPHADEPSYRSSGPSMLSQTPTNGHTECIVTINEHQHPFRAAPTMYPLHSDTAISTPPSI